MPAHKKLPATRAPSAISLLWRAESYHYYGMLRKKYPDEPIYLLAPELLIPLITVYKTLMKRMEDTGVKWEGSQSAPTGFVGVAFLLQVVPQAFWMRRFIVFDLSLYFRFSCSSTNNVHIVQDHAF